LRNLWCGHDPEHRQGWHLPLLLLLQVNEAGKTACTGMRIRMDRLGGLMATYNVSRHRKQKMAAVVALEAEILRSVGEDPVDGNVVPLRLAS
jgi:hypothetical protein